MANCPKHGPYLTENGCDGCHWLDQPDEMGHVVATIPTDPLTKAIIVATDCSPWAAGQEAEAITRSLERFGYRIVPIDTIPLPDVAPSRGPKTSDLAAKSISDMSERHWAVYQCFVEGGPMTDEEAVAYYDRRAAALRFPQQTPQSIRSRRKELVDAGHIEWTSLLRPTRAGRQARVWQAR